MKKITAIFLALMMILSATVSVNAETVNDVFKTEKSQFETVLTATVDSRHETGSLRGLNTNSKNAPRGETSTFDCGSIANTVTAVFDDSTGTLTISGTGSMKDYSSNNVPWISITDEIKKVVINSGVTSVGSYSFNNCGNLTSVTIPDGVTRIGDDAFRNCGGLTSVNIPGSVRFMSNNTFQNCKSLTSITIPGSVTAIGNSVFSGCSGLTTVVIPNSITSIGNYAFQNCSGLTSLTIPSSVTSVGYAAFQYCSGLTSLTIPENVTSLGNYAFSDCAGLTSLTIKNGVTSIGNSTFRNCKNLTSLTIPGSVTSIGDSAFRDCTGLTSLTILSGVESIGSNAFTNCNALTSVTIPGSVTSIANYAFWDSYEKRRTIFYLVSNGSYTVGSYAFGDDDILVGYNPSGIYDYCNSTRSLNRFKQYGTSYPVALNANGGAWPLGTPATINKTVGTNASLPLISGENYVFLGWAESASAQADDVVFYNTLTETTATELYAVWYKNKYTVTYAAGGNDVENMPSQTTYTKTYGTPLAVVTQEPAKNGYVFAGWSEDQTQKTPGYFAGDYITKESRSNITLYPVWSLLTQKDTLSFELFDQSHWCPYHSDYMPMVAMNLDTDGTPVNRDTDSPSNEKYFKIWTNDTDTRSPYTTSYYNDTGSFLLMNESTGDYYFNSGTRKAFFVPSKNDYRVFASGGQFLPLNTPGEPDNFYFSLSVRGDFVMPINGQVQYNNTLRPMKYTFSGDDLVYIFIDGVKVLNAGSGNKTSTYIDFSTGNILTVGDDVLVAKGSGITVQTNLRERYVLAYKEAHPECTGDNDPNLLAYLRQYFEDGSNTYKYKSEHSFAMFYAESHGLTSNINVQFNIPFTGTHNLVIDPNGGEYEGSSDTKTVALEYTETYNLLDPTTDRDKYIFSGWTITGPGAEFDSDTKTFTMGYGDTTATAQWTPAQHMLIVDPKGGVWNNKTITSYITLSYKQNTNVPDPTRTGYIFSGWTMTPTDKESTLTGKKFTMGTANTYLDAKWTAIDYNIRFEPNGGTYKGSTSPTTVTVSFGTGYDIAGASNYPVRTGHTFLGWKMTYAAGSTPNYSPTSGSVSTNTTTAYYSTTGSRTGITQQSVLLPPQRYADMKLYNLCTIGGDTAILTAQWKINEHTITYNGGDGIYNGEHSYVVNVVYDQLVTIDVNKFENTGYVFVGWNTKEDGTGDYYEESSTVRMGDEDLVLYAIWEKADFSITYVGNGGLDNNGNDTVEKFYSLKMPAEIEANMFIRKGYDFIGWSVEKITKEINDSNINEIDIYSFYQKGDYYLEGEPLTLYAVWKKVDNGEYMNITDTEKTTDTTGPKDSDTSTEKDSDDTDEPVPDKPLYGDVDCNGKVTMEDVVALQKIMAKLATHEDYGKMSRINSDCVHDDVINMMDVTEIQKFLAKLIPDLDP
ncbi:MAG: leucine-rich repeat protein [Clostridiales bacterium]|nr:leucine-rich repeat protein [Clostridiales bacterium]